MDLVNSIKEHLGIVLVLEKREMNVLVGYLNIFNNRMDGAEKPTVIDNKRGKNGGVYARKLYKIYYNEV